jgi:hypothetical protein
MSNITNTTTRPARKTMANVKPGDALILTYNGGFYPIEQLTTFIGFSDIGSDLDGKAPSDLRAKRGDAAYAVFQDPDGMVWSAYRFDGRWALGSGAIRFSIRAA